MSKPEFKISDLTAREHASRVRLYECPIITSTSELDFACRELITEFRGQEFAVLQQESWGKRYLEYQIRGYKRGYYNLLFFRTTPEIARKLTEKFLLEPTVLRFMMLKISRLPSAPSPISQEKHMDAKENFRSNRSQPVQAEVNKDNPDGLPDAEDFAMYDISYKNPAILKGYLTELNRIIPKRMTGVSASRQRSIREQILIARLLSILPFSPPVGRV